MVRFATIGTNFIVDRFLTATKNIKEMEYVSAYSRDPEKGLAFAKKYNAKRSDSNLSDLATATDIDAVYIASPNSLHCEQTILMLRNKKHVLCEKTIASNEKELQAMLDAAKENGVVLLEAMRSVFDPGFGVLIENLPKLGKIRRATFQYCNFSSKYQSYLDGNYENAFNPSLSNGALMDIGVYCVHPMVYLFGMPNRIVSDAIFLESGVDGSGTILFSYDTMQAEMIYSKIATNYLPSQIQGESATMLFREIADPREIEIVYLDGTKEVISLDKPEHNLNYEIEKWVELITENGSAEQYNEASLMTLKVMDTVRKQQNLVFPADLEERFR